MIFSGSSKGTHTVHGDIFKVTYILFMFSLYDSSKCHQGSVLRVLFPITRGDIAKIQCYVKETR